MTSSDLPVIGVFFLVILCNEEGMIMKINERIASLISYLFMNVAEASASSASCIFWHEQKCPKELLK